MRFAVPFLILLAACGSPDANTPRVSKEPLSVRGWITDVEQPPNAPFRTKETEAARRIALFQSANLWVDNAPYVSGGVAPNGSFILLDVPPGNITIEFSAQGAQSAKLVLQNIPGDADVFVPGLILRNGNVAVLDPKAIQVRMAARVAKPAPTGRTAIVAGVTVPVMNTPLAQMSDRHDYPNPPGTLTPLATVR